jgi:hypothetical protein
MSVVLSLEFIESNPIPCFETQTVYALYIEIFTSSARSESNNTKPQNKVEPEQSMAGILSSWGTKKNWRTASNALTVLAGLCLFMPLSAQQQGPIRPPAGMPAPPSDSKPKSATTTPAQDSASKSAPSVVSNEPPPIPVEQIIQKFAAREAEFKAERDNFTYTQTFIIQTLDGGRVDGEYRMTSEIVFNPEGKR